ncbi:hypothetical protein M436DRAFT_79729 [Aureobasidium namibiae CBS 147.97]|uniref:Uncharacterized protein n=1 Tax=Aureobasidium namibiae CBS 147.97 TaxID=1043004 RepID=A0A074XL74_9PEZI|nr:uncharacterized protein M436DRAFT_79729 [Aureobasidium namibiae CBS 147.97]KEQ75316.1 hypothetical protein M436DRAFT_79729 [Aureobasidium namibiae CBS 147.97]
MADFRLDPDPGKDEERILSAPVVQASDTALNTLISINEDFTQLHAYQAVHEIKTQWPDLRATDFTARKINDLFQFLRQGNILVQKSHLRAFIVAWNVLDANFPSLDATKQAKLIRDMVVSQLGAVGKEATDGDEMNTISTARTKIGVDVEEYFQNLFPESPSPSPRRTRSWSVSVS